MSVGTCRVCKKVGFVTPEKLCDECHMKLSFNQVSYPDGFPPRRSWCDMVSISRREHDRFILLEQVVSELLATIEKDTNKGDSVSPKIAETLQKMKAIIEKKSYLK